MHLKIYITPVVHFSKIILSSTWGGWIINGVAQMTNNHRLDTPRLDNTCTCSKLKPVGRDYMDSMDSVALQTKNRRIFPQLWCPYEFSVIDASVFACTHCWCQCTQSVNSLLLLGEYWLHPQYKASSLGVSGFACYLLPNCKANRNMGILPCLTVRQCPFLK